MKKEDIQKYLYENPNVVIGKTKLISKTTDVNVIDEVFDLLFETQEKNYFVTIFTIPLLSSHINKLIISLELLKKNYRNKFSFTLVAPKLQSYIISRIKNSGIEVVELSKVPDEYNSNKTRSGLPEDFNINKISSNPTYWFTSVWKATNEDYPSIFARNEKIMKELSSKLNDEKLKIKWVRFNKNYKGKFVSSAKEGDFVITILHGINTTFIHKPCRIVYKEIQNKWRTFYFIQDVNEPYHYPITEFNKLLVRNKIKEISENSVRKVASKDVKKICSFWDDF